MTAFFRLAVLIVVAAQGAACGSDRRGPAGDAGAGTDANAPSDGAAPRDAAGFDAAGTDASAADAATPDASSDAGPDAGPCGSPERDEIAVTTVASDVFSSHTPSLDIDGAGDLHLLYERTELRYAKRTAGSWATVGMTPGDDGTLRLDSSDTPHVIDVQATGLRVLRHYDPAIGGTDVTFPAGAVEVGVLAGASAVAGATVHAAFREQGSGAIRYTHLVAGSWETETVSDTGVYAPTLGMDDAGTVHILFSGGDPAGPRWGRRVGGSWVDEVVDSASSFSSPCLALEPDGSPHVFVQNGAGDFELHERTSAGWTAAGIPVSGFAGPCSAAVAPDGTLWVAVQVATGTSTRLLEIGTNATGEWRTRLMPAGQASGPALAIDDAGTVHVVWSDTSVREVRHATVPTPDGVDDDCDGSAW